MFRIFPRIIYFIHVTNFYLFRLLNRTTLKGAKMNEAVNKDKYLKEVKTAVYANAIGSLSLLAVA